MCSSDLVFIIVAAAGVYSWLLTVTGVANAATEYIAGLGMEQWLLLLVMNVFMLLVGTVLDTASAILVLTPLLADLALETEAATALSFRVARSFDEAFTDEQEAAYRRIMTPVAKYWVGKRAPNLAYEAMECLGGNGYVEEGIAGRIYREMPVNAIWEGSGNVMCLDVLRALGREPEALDVVFAEFDAARGANAHYDKAVDLLKQQFTDLGTLEMRARTVLEDLAKVAAASVLVKHAPDFVSDAFSAPQLGRAACREIV